MNILKYILFLGAFWALSVMYNFCNAQMDTLPIRIPPPDTIRYQETQENLFRTNFIVRNITIEGNIITSERLILREFPIISGDSIKIKDIPERFDFGKQQLMNTRLFHEVVVSVDRFKIRQWKNIPSFFYHYFDV